MSENANMQTGDGSPKSSSSEAVKPEEAASPEVKEEEAEERKRRGAAWWWWGAAAVVGLAGAALLGSYAYTTLMGKKKVEKQAMQNAFVFRVDGRDSKGRWAQFDFIVLKSEFTWVKGSADHVERRGQPVPEEETASAVINPELVELLKREKALIAVGLASREGERQAEEDRADQRAQTIVKWFGVKADPAMPVWRLNLGQYNDLACKGQQDADTAFERPVIFAGVSAMVAEGADVREALINAISDKENLPSRTCYSRFDMVKVR